MSDDKREAAAKRAAAAADPALVEALLRERQGYVTRGLPDRVAAVDAELARLGHEVEKPAPSRPRSRKSED